MKYIVKWSDYYLSIMKESKIWVNDQKSAIRFGSKEEALAVNGLPDDVRAVRLVPKTDDWVVRFNDDGDWVYISDPCVDENNLPNWKSVYTVEDATIFEKRAATLFTTVWNDHDGKYIFLEAIPCSQM